MCKIRAKNIYDYKNNQYLCQKLDKMLHLYTQTYGQEPKEITKLSGAGSNRQYFRISTHEGSSLIGVKGESLKENHAFITLAKHMHNKGLHVPSVVAVGDDEMTYLQEDLGSISLYDNIAACQKAGAWDDKTKEILHTILRDLPKLQFETAKGFDFNNCCREKEFCPMVIRWDLNYFKYCFLKLTGICFDEILLEEEFSLLESNLMKYYDIKADSFLYRDFQSRNVMIKDNIPYYIDFQSGYKGPFYYDVASFLWQARAAYPDDLRESLLDTYISSLQTYYKISPDSFRKNLHHYVFFRLLQVLGAYGFRGLHEHKVMFIEPIAQALSQILKYDQYPYLHSLLTEIAQLPQFQPHPAKGRLTVRITSFSFRKGIPQDYSGNGGGFVFDCRAPHNPGRYAEYKKLTGLDKEVIEFLETNSSMIPFMENVYGLVDPAVETYIRREFTSLMVNFGCTGGQHRSVYGAQHLADHLAAKYPEIKIILVHREQNIEKIYDTVSM